MIFAVAALLIVGWGLNVRSAAKATLITKVLSKDPDSLEALHRLIVERRTGISELREMLRQRDTLLDLFERGAEPMSEASRYAAMLTAVEVAQPLPIDKDIDDLEKRGLLAWTLDYALAHDPSLEARAVDLRQQVLNSAQRARATNRLMRRPEYRFGILGFRVVLPTAPSP